MTDQPLDPTSAWSGAFGADYTSRNPASDQALRDRALMWARIGRTFQLEPPKSILEVGPNLGINLRVLPGLFGARFMLSNPIQPPETACCKTRFCHLGIYTPDLVTLFR